MRINEILRPLQSFSVATLCYVGLSLLQKGETMNASPRIPGIELYVPYARTEREFLRSAVEAALRAYRAMQRKRDSEGDTGEDNPEATACGERHDR